MSELPRTQSDALLAPLAGLPMPSEEMSWRDLHRFRRGERGTAFYLVCLQYAQYLWQRRLPARAILCLDRAWGADLAGTESALRDWPLPYLPLAALLRAAPHDVFLGNPRVHFQHYADRLSGAHRERRRARAWAGWAIACRTLPHLPEDPRHAVAYPTLDAIVAELEQWGIPGESDLWRRAMGEPKR